MDYNDYIQQIATMAVVPVGDANFEIIKSSMINYAELRIQRDIDFLSTQTSGSATLSASTNVLSLATSAFVVLQTIEVTNGSGVSSPLLSVSKEYIQNVYGSGSTKALPKYFAVYGGDSSTAGEVSQNFIFGPSPNSPYGVTLTGTIRSQPLSASNPSTFISVYLPDLMIMASMIYISAYQRNFGRLNDDPQMAQTYESQYQALLKGALVEEVRKKFQSSAWTSYSPSPVATPTR
jgi:hypothetical protein